LGGVANHQPDDGQSLGGTATGQGAALRAERDGALVLDTRARLFLALTGVFITALLIGDIIGGKLFEVSVFGSLQTLSVGIIPFPITFVLTDVLNEFYGKKAARTVTYVGLGCTVFAFTVIFTAGAIPMAGFTSGAEWTGINAQAFERVFLSSQRILAASLVAYMCGQLIDIFVFHRIKALTKNRFIWARATGSTVVSQLVDTALIQTLAWYGTLDTAKLPGMILTSYAVKVVVAVALTPVIYLLHGFVHRVLKLEPVKLGDDGEPLAAPQGASGQR
jgi:queuosine precursor transporter